MKILISSHTFLPGVGGLETVSALLAGEFVRSGHEVVLMTQTRCREEPLQPYTVFRRPNSLKLLDLVSWCDIYFHNHFSLRTAWPLLLVKRPWVITHQTWIPFSRLTGRLKHLLVARTRSISISRAIAQHIGGFSRVIGNPYDDEVFYERGDLARENELVFCGRLVSEKGVDVLLSALLILKSRSLCPRLTIIGSGPEMIKLMVMAGDLGIAEQVSFAGIKVGRELAEELNAHKIMVVPSLLNEPFGVVALEGIACGCVVVGSEGGGLKEAIGRCGMTFPNGNSQALAAALEHLLTSPQTLVQYRRHAAEHLSHHTKRVVAERYLRVFAEALKGVPLNVAFSPVSSEEKSIVVSHKYQ